MACHHQIIEAESVSVATNQYWEVVQVGTRTVLQMAVDPGGNNHQLGSGADASVGDSPAVDASRLYYTINVPQDCDYEISLYTRAWDKIDGRNDLGNDLWLRVATGTDVPGETSRGSDYHKMFSSNNTNFQWANPDVGSRFCVRLPAGQHVIEIAGRSYHFQLDRIVAWCKESPCSFSNSWSDKEAGSYDDDVIVDPPTGEDLNCSNSAWDDAPTTPDPDPDPGTKQLGNNSLYGNGDLIALHYDIAPDLDDLHALAAGCTVTKCFGIDPCVVIGAHGGINGREAQYKQSPGGTSSTRQELANAVAQAAYGNNGYIDTNGESTGQWDQAVQEACQKWLPVIQSGNDIWVADGGPMDFTADVLDCVVAAGVSLNQLKQRVHVVQHSAWNENNTQPGKLNVVQNQTDYIKIQDGNNPNSTADLNDNSDLNSFENWANSSDCSAAWAAAFDGYDPNDKLDFSDTVELLHILGIGSNIVDDPTDFYNYFD